mgnify:CR=1 FL=1
MVETEHTAAPVNAIASTRSSASFTTPSKRDVVKVATVAPHLSNTSAKFSEALLFSDQPILSTIPTLADNELILVFKSDSYSSKFCIFDNFDDISESLAFTCCPANLLSIACTSNKKSFHILFTLTFILYIFS